MEMMSKPYLSLYGPGFISYALARGGYSEETAIAFSREHADENRAGCSDPKTSEPKSERAMGITCAHKGARKNGDCNC
ncbi:hypothetical protein [Bacillus thuringiensis]|uniref:hypothetical protein n=1 Tax=Bacillus thuringiensis TaxID=1428 RepID=UPI0021576DE2|nr:hypothetical protein [Bacillus thuringiensis]MCR6876156.1 hypothetical protein [Bacillus thuringiensis]